MVAEQRFFSANEVLKSALASGKRAYGIDQIARDVQDRIQRAETFVKAGDDLASKQQMGPAHEQFLAAAKLVPDYPELMGRIASTESKLKEAGAGLAKARDEMAAKRLAPALAAAIAAQKIDRGSTILNEMVAELEGLLAEQRRHRIEVSVVVGIVVTAAIVASGAIWYAVAGRDTWEEDRVAGYRAAVDHAESAMARQRYFDAHGVAAPLIEELDARKEPLEISSIVESAASLRRIEERSTPHIHTMQALQKDAEQAAAKKEWDSAVVAWDKLIQELSKLPDRENAAIVAMGEDAKAGLASATSERDLSKKEIDARLRRESEAKAEKERREANAKSSRASRAGPSESSSPSVQPGAMLSKYSGFRDACHKLEGALNGKLSNGRFSEMFLDLLDQYSLIDDKESDLRKDADEVVAVLRLLSKSWEQQIKGFGSEETVSSAMQLASNTIARFLKHHEELTPK